MSNNSLSLAFKILFLNLKCTILNSYGLFNKNQIKLNKNICILLINIHTFV